MEYMEYEEEIDPVTETISLGEPIFQCHPFAHVVSTEQKGLFCDFCIQPIVDQSTKLSCSICKYQSYCSQDCLQKDEPLHRDECVSALYKWIDTFFTSEEFKRKIPKLYLSAKDIIDFSRLFFRILKSSKSAQIQAHLDKVYSEDGFESMETDQDEEEADNDANLSSDSPFNLIIGNTKRRISWRNIVNSLELSEEYDESEEIISNYMQRYEVMTEEERVSQDKLLGYEIPKDEFFREIVSYSEAQAVLNKLVDQVSEQFDNVETFFDGGANNNNNSGANVAELNNSQTSKRFSSQQNSSFTQTFENPFSFLSHESNERVIDSLMSDLRGTDVWDKISALPLNDRKSALSNFVSSINLPQIDFSSLRKNPARRKRKRPYDDGQEEEEEEDLDEESQIERLKFMFRMIKLDFVNSEIENREKKPLDSQFGFWTYRLKQILKIKDVVRLFGLFQWKDIVKAFYVTIRFTVAIPDVMYRFPIARAVYLPMTLISHSCEPNTSAAFDGYTMKLFYLPKKLKVKSGTGQYKKKTYDPSKDTIYDPKLSSTSIVPSAVPYLPVSRQISLYELSFDFHYELFARVDASALVIMGQIRLIDCDCGRCQKLRQSCLEDKDEDDHDDEPDGFSAMLMDDDEFAQRKMEQENLSEKDEEVEEEEEDEEMDEYRQCMAVADNLNAEYGNHKDYEYSFKIQFPVKELIFLYRQLIGHYNPKVSMLLLFKSYSEMIIIQHEREDYMIFYRYKLLHKHLLETIEAFSITHGLDHPFIQIFESIHNEVHSKLGQFYTRSKAIIGHIETPTKAWSEQMFSKLSNCTKMMNLKFKIVDIEENNLLTSDGCICTVPLDLEDDPFSAYTTTSPKRDESLAYNPFSRKKRRISNCFEDENHDQDQTLNGDSNEVELLEPKFEPEPEPVNVEPVNQLNDMSKIFKLISQICNFKQFRQM